MTLLIATMIFIIYTFINITSIRSIRKKIIQMTYNGVSVYDKTQKTYKKILIITPINIFLVIMMLLFSFSKVEDSALNVTKYLFIGLLIFNIITMLLIRNKINKFVDLGKRFVITYALITSIMTSLFIHLLLAIIFENL